MPTGAWRNFSFTFCSSCAGNICQNLKSSNRTDVLILQEGLSCDTWTHHHRISRYQRVSITGWGPVSSPEHLGIKWRLSNSSRRKVLEAIKNPNRDLEDI